MGLKFAYAYAEFSRNLKRLKNAKKEISVCKISGPVGTLFECFSKSRRICGKKIKN